MANSGRCSAVSELRGFLGSVSVFQLPCLEFGVALAAELASELEAVFVEVFGFLAAPQKTHLKVALNQVHRDPR